MNERGWLQGVVSSFTRHQDAGLPLQFVINKRQQALFRILTAIVPVLQDLSYLDRLLFAHKPLGLEGWGNEF